jgi:hypothetical protein
MHAPVMAHVREPADREAPESGFSKTGAVCERQSWRGSRRFSFSRSPTSASPICAICVTRSPQHLAALGQIDVLLAPIDGAYRLSQADMVEVIEVIDR